MGISIGMILLVPQLPTYEQCTQLKQDGTATIERPPNHKLFDGVINSDLTLKSPLQLRRLQAQAKENTPAIPQIHNHITFPDNLFGMMQGHPATESLATPSAGNVARPPLANMLLPNKHQPGPTYSIEQFCHKYELDEKIQARLRENGYARTHTFKYIEVSDLQAMGFKLGEIAELKEAVRLWALQQP
jgi:hypothetical protein